MPYYVGRVVDKLENLVVRTPEQFRDKQNIEVRIRHEVVRIGIDDRKVVIRDLNSDREYEEPFDQLLIATGAKAVRPTLPGIDAGGIFGVGSLDDAARLRALLERERPERVVIVGGGYIGLEMAEAFRNWDLDVTIVGRAREPMRTIDRDMGALVSEALTKMGIHLHLGEAANSFEISNGSVSAVTTENRTLPADLVIIGAGVRPNSALAGEAGLALGVKDAIKVDDHMRTAVEGIWAAGDCAETVHVVTGEPFWVSLATVASKQGRVAGTNIGGGNVSFCGTLGTAITKVGPIEIARTGLQESELAHTAIRFAKASATAPTRSRYYPGAAPMTVKLLAEVGTGRLLGGQIVGAEGSGKRIDTVVAALHARMDIDDFSELDLAYAPPFSPVWDPVLLAARELSGMC